MRVHQQLQELKSGDDYVRLPVEVQDLSSHKALSFVRTKPTWVEPTVYSTLSQHPELASSLILLKSPDWSTTTAIYPVSTHDATHYLVVDKGSVLSTVTRIGKGDVSVWTVIVTATAEEEKDIVARAVSEARSLVGGKPKVSGNPTFFDRIGNCTWESLRRIGERPTKSLLLSLVPDLPGIYLIDDGWQDITESANGRGLRSFKTWDDFGGTLSETVSELKSRGVEEVGVWLTLQGYWDGIDEQSDLIKRYKCKAYPVAKRDQPRGNVVYPLEAGEKKRWVPTDTDGFWNDYFGELASAGISFVKVDNQASYDQITGDGAEAANAAMWRSMLKAAAKYWSTDRVIMCMSHNARMLNGPGGLDFGRPEGTLVYRNSDDFALDFADCHVDFIPWNVYSTILTEHLSVLPDFDMFASAPSDLLPIYHALLRVLGPGPTLLSDTPDVTTDKGLIEKLVARDGDGQLRVVKTQNPAHVPTGRWFWENVQAVNDGPAIVAVSSIPGLGGFIGAWNVRKTEGGGNANDEISLRDIEDAVGEKLQGDYVLLRYGLSGERETRIINPGCTESFPFTLSNGQCELFIVSRVFTDDKGRSFAILGYLDKLAPLAGISLTDNGTKVKYAFYGEVSAIVFDDDSKLLSSSSEGLKEHTRVFAVDPGVRNLGSDL